MATDAESIRNQLRITCADALELMTEYLERALGAEDQDRFRSHLGGCEACAAYLDQLQLTVRVSASLGDQDRYAVDQPTMDRLLEIYRATQDDAGHESESR